MSVLKAKIIKGVPHCPECSYKYDGNVVNYGYNAKGYWFVFRCNECTSSEGKSGKKLKKERKVFVRYQTDKDFKVIEER